MSTRSAPRPNARHPRESWSSRNRMLTGSSKKGSVVGRNPNFDTEETKLLIQLWGDPKIQRTLITTHKKHVVILQLAAKMRQYGYDRSAEEITTRIKNLKCFYNRLKKDMESSEKPTTEPSWRHFADMDEIMTRPIFSVRPNEIPQPSLKYQLEQEREEREQRKRKAIEEGRTLSDSDEDIEDIIAVSTVDKPDLSDDGIIPDAEVDIEAADEAFAALMQDAPKKRKFLKSSSETSPYNEQGDELDEDDQRLLIKEEFEQLNESEGENTTKSENHSQAKTENEATRLDDGNQKNSDDTNDSCVALIIPKDEPIDVDEENESEITNKNQNPKIAASLGEMLKLTQNGMVAISSSAGNILIPVSSVSTVNATNSASKLMTTFSNTVISTSSVSGSNQGVKPGKISLVPTNFLMQSQSMPNCVAVANATKSGSKISMPAQSLQLIQGQMPNRFVLSKTQNSSPNKAASTGIVTTGPGGMKVLLVNAETAGAGGTICMPTNLGQKIVSSSTSIAPNAIGTVLPNVASTKTIQSQSPSLPNLQPIGQHQPTQQEKTALKRKEEEILAKKKRERLAQREEMINRREGTGMRNLLRTLLNVQTQANDLQKQRLSLERERLEFEKKAAERFFTMLPTLFAAQQTKQHQPQPQFFNLLPQQQQKTQQLRLNPTKLVFATGTLPSSAIVTPSISNVVSNIATSTTQIINNISNDANSTIEVEDSGTTLLTPKVEKED